MRFNHMELTLPKGTLTSELREEIDAFYGPVFGWKGFDNLEGRSVGAVADEGCAEFAHDDRLAERRDDDGDSRDTGV